MANKTYGSANNLARRTTKIYGPTNRHIANLDPVVDPGPATCSVTSVQTMINKMESQSYITTAIAGKGTVEYFKITAYISTSGNTAGQTRGDIYLFYKNASGILKRATVYLDQTITNVHYEAERWGIAYSLEEGSTGDTFIYLNGTYSCDAREINKFYGSVGGQAKLIHQGFGHLSYN